MSEAETAERLIGATDRGTLWSVRSGGRTAIERRLDPRACNHEFRQALAGLKDKQYPRLAPIGKDGWSGIHYRVEYSLEEGSTALAQCFEAQHWRRRLEIVTELCRILPEWGQALARPYGLNPLNLVVTELAGRLYPWLLACPPVKAGSAWDLHECDAAVLCSIAPEVIRGMPCDARLTDSFALGVLAAMALGFEPRSNLAGGEALEAQACGDLLRFEVNALPVERFFSGVAELKELARLIARHLEFVPEARPVQPTELQECCERVVRATEPAALALELARQSRPGEALEVLEWGIGTYGDSMQARLLAAGIAEHGGDLPGALRHLDRCVELDPVELALRERRVGVAYRVYLAKAAPHPGDSDETGDRLLKDLELLKLLPAEPGSSNAIHKMSAAVHRHRGDLYGAAGQLHEAARLEPTDLEALAEYAGCLRDLGDVAGARAAAGQGIHRAERMAVAQMLSDREATKWKARFQALLPQQR